jgi:diguanylate cyclase (GGDEF)-like protein
MSLAQRFGDWLLTTHPHQRVRLAQSALASLLMMACVAVMYTAGATGVVRTTWLPLWTCMSLGGLVVVFLLIRSGWSLRFTDPSLTLAQMLYAITCAAAAYPIAGQGAGATLGVLAMVLNFGMFGLSTRQIVAVALYAVFSFGLVIAALVWWLPGSVSTGVALAHLMMVVLEVIGVSFLTSRLQRMRDRLRKRKADLEEALERIRTMAMRDDLTGLVNRRHMMELLTQECHRGERSGRSFSLALLDIDHFKQVNDQHGHAVGDEVLRAFARATAGVVRASDTLARWGGEEFVLMLPDTPPEIGVRCLERLRESVALMRVPSREGIVQVTVSAGLTRRRNGETIEQTIDRADRALYSAKAQGRNRVVVS